MAFTLSTLEAKVPFPGMDTTSLFLRHTKDPFCNIRHLSYLFSVSKHTDYRTPVPGPCVRPARAGVEAHAVTVGPELFLRTPWLRRSHGPLMFVNFLPRSQLFLEVNSGSHRTLALP